MASKLRFTWRRLLIVLGVFAGLGALSQKVAFRLNITHSLPGKVYVGIRGPVRPKVGDIVAFTHPMFAAPIAKVVVGVAGHYVDVVGTHVFVNGVHRGDLLTHSTRSGKPLIPITSCKIPEGYVYVWAPHPQSFDSRYALVGLVTVERIEEKLWRVF